MATIPDSQPTVGRWVEGVGDEVVVAGGSVVAICVAVLALRLLSSGERQRAVHPEQYESVQRARAEMGVEEPRNRTENGTETETTETQSCPICLASLTHSVNTNCGHTFCAECILNYWRHDQWPRAARCALCRNQITLLLPSPTLTAASSPDLWRRVVDYNQRMSGEFRPIMSYINDIPAILAHLWRHLFTVQGLALLYKIHILVIAFLLLLYVISPLDIIPEAVFGFLGLLDDIIIFSCVLAYIVIVYHLYITQGNNM